jgi:hypothetical protein
MHAWTSPYLEAIRIRTWHIEYGKWSRISIHSIQLLSRQSAVDVQRDASDPLRIVTREVNSSAGMVKRVAEDAARNHRLDAVGSCREGAAERVIEHGCLGNWLGRGQSS